MPGWVPTGNLNWAREGHTATLLHDGTVLVHGGSLKGADSDAYLSTAELFDPGTRTWTLTANAFYQRSYHTATLLQNGKVLVVGGTLQPCWSGGGRNCGYVEAQLYDPATGSWALFQWVTRRPAWPTVECLWREDLVTFRGRNLIRAP
jgi:hypothetical protein